VRDSRSWSLREDSVLTRPELSECAGVPFGFDSNRKPRLLLADHVIVAGHGQLTR